MTDAATQGTSIPRRTIGHASAGPEEPHTVGWSFNGQVLIATAAGELTFPKARAMAHEIERHLTPDTSRVVLDISGVTSGRDAVLLGCLLSVRTTLRRRAGRLTIVAGREHLDRLVRVSALDDLLTIVPSIEDALVTPDPAAQTPPTSRNDDVAA